MSNKLKKAESTFKCYTGDATVDILLSEIHSDVKTLLSGNGHLHNPSVKLFLENNSIKDYVHHVELAMGKLHDTTTSCSLNSNENYEDTKWNPFNNSLFVAVLSMVTATACYSNFSGNHLAKCLQENTLQLLSIFNEYELELHSRGKSYKEFEVAKHDVLNHYFEIAFKENLLKRFVNYNIATSKFYSDALCVGIDRIFSNDYELVCHRCYWLFSDINSTEDFDRFTDKYINDCSDKEFQLGLAILFIKAFTYGTKGWEEKSRELLSNCTGMAFTELLDYTNKNGIIGRYLACIPIYHPILSDFSCSLNDLINVGKKYISPPSENETTDNTSTESHSHQSNSFNIPDNFFLTKDNLASNIDSRFIKKELQGKDHFEKVIGKITDLLVNKKFIDNTPAVRNSFIIAITGRYLDKGVRFEKVKLNEPAAANNICYIVKHLCQKPGYDKLGKLFIPYQDNFKWESNRAERNILDQLRKIVDPYAK